MPRQAATRGKIQHAQTRDQRRSLGDMTGERLGTWPGKGPERRRQVLRREYLFRRLPQRRYGGGQVKLDARRQNSVGNRHVPANEGFKRFGDQAARRKRFVGAG
jgi:hypothetical protein